MKRNSKDRPSELQLNAGGQKRTMRKNSPLLDFFFSPSKIEGIENAKKSLDEELSEISKDLQTKERVFMTQPQSHLDTENVVNKVDTITTQNNYVLQIIKQARGICARIRNDSVTDLIIKKRYNTFLEEIRLLSEVEKVHVNENNNNNNNGLVSAGGMTEKKRHSNSSGRNEIEEDEEEEEDGMRLGVENEKGEESDEKNEKGKEKKCESKIVKERKFSMFEKKENKEEEKICSVLERSLIKFISRVESSLFDKISEKKSKSSTTTNNNNNNNNGNEENENPKRSLRSIVSNLSSFFDEFSKKAMRLRRKKKRSGIVKLKKSPGGNKNRSNSNSSNSSNCSNGGKTLEKRILCRLCEKFVVKSKLKAHREICLKKRSLLLEFKKLQDNIYGTTKAIEKRINNSENEVSRILQPMELKILTTLLTNLNAVVTVKNVKKMEYIKAIKKEVDELKKNTPVFVYVNSKDLKKRKCKTLPLFFDRFETLVGRKIKILEEAWRLGMKVLEPLQPLTINDFQNLGLITKGAYGRVFLARKKKTGDLFAIKVLRKGELNLKNLVKERDLHLNATASCTKKKEISLKKSGNEKQKIGASKYYTNNPFCIKVYYTFHGENYWFIVQEYAPGGDLFSLLVKEKFLDVDQAKEYTAQILLALEFLESQNIIHRDLKPDNILIDRMGYLKLTDFGLSEMGKKEKSKNIRKEMERIREQKKSNSQDEGSSRFSSSQDLFEEVVISPEKFENINANHSLLDQSFIDENILQKSKELGLFVLDDEGDDEENVCQVRGTPDYIAPELLNDEEHSFGVDHWALGVILFSMLIGYPPFNDLDPDSVFDNIRRGDIHWPKNLVLYEIPDEAIDLIKSLLIVDSKKRLGYNGVQEIKNHEWFSGLDWDNLLNKIPMYIPEVKSEEDIRNFGERSKYYTISEKDKNVKDFNVKNVNNNFSPRKKDEKKERESIDKFLFINFEELDQMNEKDYLSKSYIKKKFSPSTQFEMDSFEKE